MIKFTITLPTDNYVLNHIAVSVFSEVSVPSYHPELISDLTDDQ